ncbi:hypothetical protein J7J74_01585 [bacterium]|nr:hypothetical protein [bacterium]
MAELKYFKTEEQDSISSGGSWSDNWTPDEDLVIRRIYLKNKDGSAFTDSTFYLKISETVYTHSVVPAAILGPDREVSPELNIPVRAKQKIDWTFKNNESSSVSVFLVFECVKK